MGFDQPYPLSLLAFKEISCHEQKSGPMIKSLILIISLAHLWYSVCKNNTENAWYHPPWTMGGKERGGEGGGDETSRIFCGHVNFSELMGG